MKSDDKIIPLDNLTKIKENLYFGVVKYMAIGGLKMSKYHQNM